MWNGYFRCKVNAGLTAGNKATLEAQGLKVACNCSVCTDKSSCCCCLTNVRYSLDDKEAISELQLASAPANAGISEDDFEILTAEEANDYIVTNIANWEA